MILVNQILNSIHEWHDPNHTAFQRQVGTRVANLFATAPVEAMAVAQNVLIAPVQLVGIVLGGGAKVIYQISGSKSLNEFAKDMPTLKDLVRTVTRIIAYAIGTIMTATLGVINPEANFKAHCNIGLAINETEERQKPLQLLDEISLLQQEAEQAKMQIEEEQSKPESIELENLATAYATAGKLAQEADEDIIEDESTIMIRAEAIADQIEAEHAAALEETTTTIVEKQIDTDLSEEETNPLIDLVQIALAEGKKLLQVPYDAIVYSVSNPGDASRKVANFVTVGYYFAPSDKI